MTVLILSMVLCAGSKGTSHVMLIPYRFIFVSIALTSFVQSEVERRLVTLGVRLECTQAYQSPPVLNWPSLSCSGSHNFMFINYAALGRAAVQCVVVLKM